MNLTNLGIALIGFFALLVVSALLRTYLGDASPLPKRYKYTVKGFFFTREKRTLYDTLVAALGTSYLIFARVPLTAVLDCTTERQNADAAKLHIMDKRLDFVLVGKADNAPKLGVLLEKGPHDEVIEDVLKDSGLPLLQLDNRTGFDAAGLARRVSELALK
jgi:hypothetical protein